ncbi:RNA polymerase sigma factor [Streptomyces peucetius]|nr:RNA polymerase subunit sigma [Streptomyces peucetius subsp. caesius ATCC 27952]
MSGHDEPAERGSADGHPADRWQRVLSHRESLLKVARRRSMNVDDAEDAVHEAMVRAAENANVDDARLGAWLTSVTIRLCVDRYRQINREADVHARSARAAAGPATVEEAVCDQAEAKWLAGHSADLPPRQAEVLSLRAQGFDLAQISQRTGLSYQAVRSLLARARRALRAVLAATLVLAVWVWRGRPRVVKEAAQTAALASVAVTLTVAGLALSPPSEAETEEAPLSRRPYVTHLPAGPGPLAGRREPTPSETALAGLRVRLGDGPVSPTAVTPLPSASETPSNLQGTVLPALPTLPALPEGPELALPTAPDVSAVVPSRLPVPPLDPSGPVGSIEPGRALVTLLPDR